MVNLIFINFCPTRKQGLNYYARIIMLTKYLLTACGSQNYKSAVITMNNSSLHVHNMECDGSPDQVMVSTWILPASQHKRQLSQ